MKIVVIDGQGGRIGKALIEQLRSSGCTDEILAVGTNSIATSAMLKAGADAGATGENPVIVATRDADVVVGPIGIIAADSMLGEITPLMAQAVGSSRARKILVPVNRCFEVAGVRQMGLSEYVQEAVDLVLKKES